MRDVPTRAGYCTAAGMLSFVGIAALMAGNTAAFLVEFILVGVVYLVALGQVRRGRL